MNEKSDDNRWLKDAILSYIKKRNGKKTNLQDIMAEFKIALIFECLNDMVDDGELVCRNLRSSGEFGHHTYEIINKTERV